MNGNRIPEVGSISVLGLTIGGSGSNDLVIQKIIGKVESALRLLRRIVNRNSGTSEECAIRLGHAFVLCQITCIVAMLSWRKQKKKS